MTGRVGVAVIDYLEMRAELNRLREGLRQIVEGDYPADAGNGETWAAELLHDSHCVEWEGWE